jgi:hypothetical protein
MGGHAWGVAHIGWEDSRHCTIAHSFDLDFFLNVQFLGHSSLYMLCRVVVVYTCDMARSAVRLADVQGSAGESCELFFTAPKSTVQHDDHIYLKSAEESSLNQTHIYTA